MKGVTVEAKVFSNEGLKLRDVKKFILSTFIIFLPFAQALTINLFFPLKISEIAVFLFLAYSFAGFLFDRDVKLRFNAVVSTVGIFILIVLFATIVNFFKSFPYELDLSNVRTSKNVDSALKFFYLILAFVGMQMTYVAVKTYGKEAVLKWFLIGATIASLYTWYLSLSSAFNIPYIKLPGMDPIPQNLNVSFGRVIRCGTFKEGNYMGLYLFIAGALANYKKRTALSVFLFLTIIPTFSTVSFVCVLVYTFLNALKSEGSKVKALVGLGIIIIALGGLMAKSEDFRTIVINKMFSSEEEVENANDVVSRLDRLNTTQIGWEIFSDNPLTGVGPANFGLHFAHYNQLAKLGEGDYKRIPNNIYVEMLSESGVFSLLSFLSFMVVIIKNGFKTGSRFLILGLILSFIYLAAFPTYTTLFIWFFWGFVVAEAEASRERQLV